MTATLTISLLLLGLVSGGEAAVQTQQYVKFAVDKKYAGLPVQNAKSVLDCGRKCSSLGECLGFNFQRQDGGLSQCEHRTGEHSGSFVNQTGWSHYGKVHSTFIMGFLQGDGINDRQIYVINPGPSSAVVSVRTPLDDFDEVENVDPGQAQIVSVPVRYQCTGSTIDDKGFEIHATNDVIIQALTLSATKSDGILVPPITDLGYVHVAVTYRYTAASTNQGAAELVVVATEADTEVEMLLNGPYPLTVYFGGSTYHSGDVIRVQLAKYQTAQVKVSWANGGDLSGTLVTSSKPVFVSSGAASASVGEFNGRDHLVDNLLPVDRLGTDYVLATPRDWLGSVIRVVGLVDDTTLDVYQDDGNLVLSSHVLDAFVLYDVDASPGNAYHVTADKPISVSQFAKGSEGQGNSYDPFFVQHEPISKYLAKDAVFATMEPPDRPRTHYVQISTQTATKADLVLDGSPLVCPWLDLSSVPYSVCQTAITAGVHSLTGATFSGFVFGGALTNGNCARVSPTPGSYVWTSTATSLAEALLVG